MLKAIALVLTISIVLSACQPDFNDPAILEQAKRCQTDGGASIAWDVFAPYITCRNKDNEALWSIHSVQMYNEYNMRQALQKL